MSPLPRFFSYGVLIFTPLFFSSNLLFGKTVIGSTEPWTLAFLRWGLVAVLLFPFVFPALRTHWLRVKNLIPLCAIMGFLGMWICGAVVYFGLSLTSATNATLIYLSSPVLIIVAEAFWRGRRITVREAFGIVLASLGVSVILLRGEIANAFALNFNAGDLAMVFAAIAWAVYSVVFKSDVWAGLPSAMLLCLFSGLGALCLLPFAVIEIVYITPLPRNLNVWSGVAGIVLSASIVAFLGYQYSVRFAGPAIAGIFMYLLPVYGVGLAVLVLGETLEQFHLVGILTILGGVVLATFPIDLLRRRINGME